MLRRSLVIFLAENGRLDPRRIHWTSESGTVSSAGTAHDVELAVAIDVVLPLPGGGVQRNLTGNIRTAR